MTLTENNKDLIIKEFIRLSIEKSDLAIELEHIRYVADISEEDLEEFIEDMEESKFIANKLIGQDRGGYTYFFNITNKLRQFVTDGGFSGASLERRRRAQTERDLENANIRSADAAEASALAAIKSANEARYSRYAAIIAVLISIITFLLQFRGK